MVLNNQLLDNSNLESGNWRQYMSEAGIRSLLISGSGVFTDSASEELFRTYAFGAATRNYQFCFANGDYVTGPFQVSAYERSGNHDGAEVYALTLESAGNILFTNP